VRRPDVMNRYNRIAGFLMPLAVAAAALLLVMYMRRPHGIDRTAKAFEKVYKDKLWGTNANGKGYSGYGSTAQATVLWRTFLQQFMKENNIKSVVDAGCGDWESTNDTDWTGIDYKGYDIVDSVIQADKAKYEKPNIHFFTGNVVTTDLPAADLLIVKHVLQHLSNAEVAQLLTQVPKYKHVLLVDSVNNITLTGDNKDISAGDFREMDPTKPPFEVPGDKPLTYYDGGNMQQIVHVASKQPAAH